ncbi:MAG: DUF429 domain-containing protein [Chloroflexota bacterium]|nr:DUF429 domain-containing protein [Chloroflexota bacterium]
MLFRRTIFIGIDPTAGKRPMAYAALDRDLRLHCLDKGDYEEIAAYVGGQENAFVAICGPQRPNQGLMKRAEVRENLNPVPRSGRWRGFRVGEYQLYQHKIRTPRTPAQEEDCAAWMQTSFALYRRLKKMGYQNYPHQDDAHQVQDDAHQVQDGGHQLLEVYPHGAFTTLLESIPFKKDTLEGRLQRQLVLHNLGLDVPDPMRIFDQITRYRLMQGILPLDGLYSTDELDAIVAAYTAWVAAIRPGDVTVLGDPTEGEIVLPVKVLRKVYV